MFDKLRIDVFAQVRHLANGAMLVYHSTHRPFHIRTVHLTTHQPPTTEKSKRSHPTKSPYHRESNPRQHQKTKGLILVSREDPQAGTMGGETYKAFPECRFDLDRGGLRLGANHPTTTASVFVW